MLGIWSKSLLSFILSAMFIATLISLPQSGNAGHLAGMTDLESSRLIGYWDLRDRDTFFQVTNTSGEDVRVHIQLYDASGGCSEFNYFDTLTPRDTHVYDVSSLTRNNGSALAAPDLSGGYGILGVTVVSGSDSFLDDLVLTGNQRIVDGSGYEYRTNLVGADDTSPESRYTAHFNNVDGSSSADFIVIGIDYITSPGGFIPVTEEYFVRLHDVDENPISCPNAVIGCVEGNINVGINQTVTNSRDGASVCLGTDAVGYIEIDADDDGVEDDDISDAYIHFMGLNNNAGTGSMDSAVATDFLDNNVE